MLHTWKGQCCGTYNLPRQSWVRPFKRHYNASLTKGGRVIAISHFIASHIIENYDTPWNKIKVIHRGIDQISFNPDKISSYQLAQQHRHWNLPDTRQIILMPGRLTRWKGQKILIDAIAKLPHPRPLCLIIGAHQGREKYYHELEQYIVEKKLVDDVHIFEPPASIPVAMMLSDIVVSASIDPEAFGRVSAEAMMMGRMIVAPNHGAACEQIDHHQNGFLFAPSNSDSLAAILKQVLMLSPERRMQISQHARQKALRLFSRDLMQNKTLDLYHQLLEE
ncbi:MAG: glycosyltransferase [Pseudomonadota bacterium]